MLVGDLLQAMETNKLLWAILTSEASLPVWKRALGTATLTMTVDELVDILRRVECTRHVRRVLFHGSKRLANNDQLPIFQACPSQGEAKRAVYVDWKQREKLCGQCMPSTYVRRCGLGDPKSTTLTSFFSWLASAGFTMHGLPESVCKFAELDERRGVYSRTAMQRLSEAWHARPEGYSEEQEESRHAGLMRKWNEEDKERKEVSSDRLFDATSLGSHLGVRLRSS